MFSYISDENPSAPAPREMSELETSLANLERDLSDVTTNYVALRKNQLELLELKHLLLKTEAFLSETPQLQLASSSGGGDAEDGENRSEFCMHIKKKFKMQKEFYVTFFKSTFAFRG